MDTKEIPRRLLPWFAENARPLPWRADREPYHVWLSEIMLQQTRAEAVKPYYARFLAELPSIRALAECPEDRLMKLWEGLGYYTRARNLQNAAKQVISQHGGVFPRTYAEIRSLAGIGDYTAGAVASICFGLPEPAVDGNVLRVYTRLFADSRCTDEPQTKRSIGEALKQVYEAQTPDDRNLLTQSLMELGATVCVPNGAPHCTECPCSGICAAYQAGTQTKYPVRKEKRPRRREEYTVYILHCGDEIAVQKRPDTGLLAGLWELPHLDGTLDEQTALPAADRFGTGTAELLSIRKRTHIFTHIEWHMTCVHLRVGIRAPQFVWVTPEQLAAETALPSAFRICLT